MSRIATASENRGEILTEQVSTPQRSQGSTSLISRQLVSLLSLVLGGCCYNLTRDLKRRRRPWDTTSALQPAASRDRVLEYTVCPVQIKQEPRDLLVCLLVMIIST